MFAWKLMTLGFVAVALVFLSAGGCASNPAYDGFGDNGTVAAVNKSDRALVVVPVKGQPIMVRTITVPAWAFSLAILPAVGVGQMEQAAATKINEVRCARLNQNTELNAERILAEECVRLLKASPKTAFQSTTVHPNDAVMSWTQDLEPAEHQHFKVNCPNIVKWVGLFEDWQKRPVAAGSNPVPGQRVVYLETTMVCSIMNDGNSLMTQVGLRMIDAGTGETLRIATSSHGGPITQVTESSDLKVFASELRNFMSICAEAALRDMGLL